MQTDWVLIGRLAAELEARLRGSRVQDAGLLDDGRIGLVLRNRGGLLVLAVDLFGSPPLVTVEEAQLAIMEEPGFVRALARTLKGMTLESVNARRFDRLLRLRFGSRSRFGVGEQVDCYLELVPRFGNMLLVKNESIVAARKEFAPSENARRVVVAGGPYVLPPLPANPRTVEQAETDRPVLELFAELRATQSARAENEGIERRRRALQKRLDEREAKLRRELEQLGAKRARAAERESLRAQGEAIFATLHELDPERQETEKERAGALFAEYKRLGKSLPHIETRQRSVDDALAVIETLRWEADRAGAGEELADVESAFSETDRRKRASSVARPVAPKRKRRALELRTPSGSRIFVGRSPLENADLTFRVARPNDLWFHTQRVPGAHVILARDDRSAPPDEDLQTAASLAAYYSKARASASVAVDYTIRKHVRKQRDAPPGLVWYTHAKTIVALPQPLEALQSDEREGPARAAKGGK